MHLLIFFSFIFVITTEVHSCLYSFGRCLVFICLTRRLNTGCVVVFLLPEHILKPLLELPKQNHIEMFWI